MDLSRTSKLFDQNPEEPEDPSQPRPRTSAPPPVERKHSSAALRREQWRDTQQQSVEEHVQVVVAPTTGGGNASRNYLYHTGKSASNQSGELFKFDSFEKDRYICPAGMAPTELGVNASNMPTVQPVRHPPLASTTLYASGGSSTCSVDEPMPPNLVATYNNYTEPDHYSSPVSGRSPHSSMSSPQVSVDSPRICFSPLRIKDSIEEEDNAVNAAGMSILHTLPKLSVRGCESEEGTSPGGSSNASGITPYPGTSGHWLEPSTSPNLCGQSHKLLPGYLGNGQSISRPISPIPPSLTPTTPISPATTPLHTLRHLPVYLTEVYKRRCLSDTDLSFSGWDDPNQPHPQRHSRPPSRRVVSQDSRESRVKDSISPCPYSRVREISNESYGGGRSRYLCLPSKGGSLESEASSTATQESPLDLSVRSSASSSVTGFTLKAASIVTGGSVDSIQQPPRGRGRSLGRGSSPRSHNAQAAAAAFRGTVSVDRATISMERYSLDRLDISPVVETLPPGASSDMAFICPLCGQMFSLSDRLAKHMASRHKSRSTDGGSGSGSGTGGSGSGSGSGGSRENTKSYSCDVCKRCFARSDMLTRHMRLHTGVKPYTCRICGQVFSRSDHLSTHQRTHTGEKPYRCPSCPYAACRRDMITRHMRTHARYELQDSLSVEDAQTDSPISTAGSLMMSRSVSCESTDPPPPQHPPPPPPAPPAPPPVPQRASQPDSPMDTAEQGNQFCHLVDQQ